MVQLATTESENTNLEVTPEASNLKVPSSKRAPASPAAGKSSAAPPPSKKGFVSRLTHIFLMKISSSFFL